MNATDRGNLAERLLPVAARISCLVHGDGDHRDIHQAVARLDTDERNALIVVLAALVDPEASVEDTLGFITWDEHGRPAGPQILTGTIRQLANGRWWPTPGDGADEILVAEQKHTAWVLHLHGHDYGEISERLGTCRDTVARWLKERRRAAA